MYDILKPPTKLAVKFNEKYKMINIEFLNKLVVIKLQNRLPLAMGGYRSLRSLVDQPAILSLNQTFILKWIKRSLANGKPKNRDYHRWGISDIAKCILFDDLLILVS